MKNSFIFTLSKLAKTLKSVQTNNTKNNRQYYLLIGNNLGSNGFNFINSGFHKIR